MCLHPYGFASSLTTQCTQWLHSSLFGASWDHLVRTQNFSWKLFLGLCVNHQLSFDSWSWVHSESPAHVSEAGQDHNPQRQYDSLRLCFEKQIRVCLIPGSILGLCEAIWETRTRTRKDTDMWGQLVPVEINGAPVLLPGTSSWAILLESLLEETQTLQVREGKSNTGSETSLCIERAAILWMDHSVNWALRVYNMRWWGDGHQDKS